MNDYSKSYGFYFIAQDSRGVEHLVASQLLTNTDFQSVVSRAKALTENLLADDYSVQRPSLSNLGAYRYPDGLPIPFNTKKEHEAFSGLLSVDFDQRTFIPTLDITEYITDFVIDRPKGSHFSLEDVRRMIMEPNYVDTTVLVYADNNGDISYGIAERDKEYTMKSLSEYVTEDLAWTPENKPEDPRPYTAGNIEYIQTHASQMDEQEFNRLISQPYIEMPCELTTDGMEYWESLAVPEPIVPTADLSDLPF